MRFACYLRVSTSEQSCDMQLMELRRYCEARGITIHAEYIDHGISGSKKSRPALDRLMDDANKRKFDGVLVYRFDRFARSTRHLLDALETFRNLNIHFISYNENIDTSSPLGTAMFTICSAIAQLERDIIRERVRSGVANARAKGKRLGRPQKVETSKILDLRQQGLSCRKIAAALGISRSTVSTLLRKAG